VALSDRLYVTHQVDSLILYARWSWTYTGAGYMFQVIRRLGNSEVVCSAMHIISHIRCY